MKEVIRLTSALTIICMIATALLTFVNEKTKEPIAKAQALQKAAALKKALPKFNNDPFSEVINLKTEDGNFQLLPARNNKKLVGVAIIGYTNQGFSGKIESVIGFDTKNNITRIMVTKHGETPGLGTKVCDRARQKTLKSVFSSNQDNGPVPNIFLDQFNNMPLQKASTDATKVDAISGATVSSKAMMDAVSRITKRYLQYIKDNGDVK